jgi:hypothetical protein
MAENAAFPLSDVKLQVSEDWVVGAPVNLLGMSGHLLSPEVSNGTSASVVYRRV